jgi:hypothetical protein
MREWSDGSDLSTASNATFNEKGGFSAYWENIAAVKRSIIMRCTLSNLSVRDISVSLFKKTPHGWMNVAEGEQ